MRAPSAMLKEDVSNLTGIVPDGLEDKLKESAGTVCSQHSAWNFCGYIWFEDGEFHEEVWQHNRHVETFSAPSIEELVGIANEKYGYD